MSVSLVVGCGTTTSVASNSENSTTTSTNGNIVGANTTSNGTNKGDSNTVALTSNATSGGVTSGNVPSSQTGTTSKDGSITYTSAQIKSIETSGSQADLTIFYIPYQGLGSRFLYAQDVAAAPGGYILVLNYSDFSMQAYVKPMLTGRAVMKTVNLKIAGIEAPVIGTWNAPPTGSGAQPTLTFKIQGVYYLIQKPKSLSQSQVQEIADSLQKV